MILLTGFEKFGQFKENVSEVITNSFPETIQDLPVIKKVLPLSWKYSVDIYKSLLISLKNSPKIVIMMGVYLGKKILIERYAWNIAIGLDNLNKYKFGVIKLTDCLRKKADIDFKKFISMINEPKKILLSSYPGFFLCNYIYFWAISLAKGNYPVIFIHLPSKGNIQVLKNNIIYIIKVISSNEKKDEILNI